MWPTIIRPAPVLTRCHPHPHGPGIDRATYSLKTKNSPQTSAEPTSSITISESWRSNNLGGTCPPKRLGTSRTDIFSLRCLKLAHKQHRSCHTSQNAGQTIFFSQSPEPTFPRYNIHKRWRPFPVNRKLKRHTLRLFTPMGVVKRAKAVVGCSAWK